MFWHIIESKEIYALKYKRFVSALYVLNIIAQAIFTLLTPPLLFFFFAWLLVERAGTPDWTYAVAIIIGVLLGLVSMVKFTLSASLALERLEKQNDKSGNKNEKKQ